MLRDQQQLVGNLWPKIKVFIDPTFISHTLCENILLGKWCEFRTVVSKAIVSSSILCVLRISDHVKANWLIFRKSINSKAEHAWSNATFDQLDSSSANAILGSVKRSDEREGLIVRFNVVVYVISINVWLNTESRRKTNQYLLDFIIVLKYIQSNEKTVSGESSDGKFSSWCMSNGEVVLWQHWNLAATVLSNLESSWTFRHLILGQSFSIGRKTTYGNECNDNKNCWSLHGCIVRIELIAHFRIRLAYKEHEIAISESYSWNR